MSGYASYDAGAVLLDPPGVMMVVQKYDEDAPEGYRFTPLPNVRCLNIQILKGAEPPVAKFRYAFDEARGEEGDPTRIQHVYGSGVYGPRVVRNGDRVVVRLFSADGGSLFLFDGFAHIPQVDMDRNSEMSTFIAYASVIREWDNVFGGAYARNEDHPDVVSDVQTNIDPIFNPAGIGNATPEGADAGEEGEEFPTFFGPFKVGEAVNGFVPRKWTLPMAIRYIVMRGRMDKFGARTNWTQVNLDDADTGLMAMVPKIKGRAVNWLDPDTFDLADIYVQDFSIRGEAWPEVAQRILEPHGFTVAFRLYGWGEEPLWGFEVYREDINVPVKTLRLQSVDSTLDPTQSNVAGLEITRDTKDIANRHVVDTDPALIEASYVLSELFSPDETDADHKSDFELAKVAKSPAKRKLYRWFGLDEAGEGHWDRDAGATVDTVPDLGPILDRDETRDDVDEGAADDDDAAKEKYEDIKHYDDPRFVVRRRKPIGDLISTHDGAKLEAQLYVSEDYDGACPDLWDGSGTWQRVTGSQWKLLPDRIGIEITAEKPDAFSVGKVEDASQLVFGDEVIDIIQRTAAPTAGQKAFRFRLTCVVQDDQGIAATADRRAASPTPFEITRRTDANDRFKLQIISRFSHLHPVPGPDSRDRRKRNDVRLARDHAMSMRRAHERATFGGNVTVGRIDLGYQVGDKISLISGRGIAMQTNAATEEGESATLPSVVSITYAFDVQQHTTFALDDLRAEPPKRRYR